MRTITMPRVAKAAVLVMLAILTVGSGYGFADGVVAAEKLAAPEDLSASSAPSSSPPGRPARPTVGAVSHDSVTISWADPGDSSITGYQILRRNRDTDAKGNFTIIEDDTGTAATTYTDDSVAPATRYGYRVKARNAHGLSPRSRSVRADTPAEPEPTPEPTAVTLSLNPDSVGEDAAATPVAVTASLNNSALPTATDVTVSVSGGTATSGTDYAAVSTFTVTIAGGQTSGTAQWSFDPTQDSLAEGDETVILRGSAAGLAAGTATLTITDDDPAPTAVTISLNPNAVGEDASATAVTVTASLNNSALPTATDVTVSVTGGTATSGTDYAVVSDFTVTIAGGQTSGTAQLSFDPTEDNLAEGGETVILSGSATGLTAGTATLTIEPTPDPVPDPVPAQQQEGDAEDDYPADTSTSGSLTVGTKIQAKVDFIGDRDWFSVGLEKDRTYHIDQWGGWIRHQTLLHGMHDDDGNLIEGTTDEERGSGSDSHVVFTPAEDGTYYVAAGADESGRYDSLPVFLTAHYWLSVIDVTDGHPEDAYTGDTGTTGAIDVDGHADSEVNFRGDRDWFAVTLESDTEYQIDILGWPTRHGELDDPYLAGIYDDAGTLIANTENDNGGYERNSRKLYSATRSGTHYVSAGGIGNYKGTYRLAVRDNTDDYAADTSTTGTIAVPGTAAGRIERRGDRDWFSFSLEADVDYVFDVKGKIADSAHDELDDPYLHGIYDNSGVYIDCTQDNDGGYVLDSRVLFTPITAGTYYISAGHNDGNRRELGTYTVSVTEDSDDYSANTCTTGTVDVEGEVTGEIEEEGDQDWFAVSLQQGVTYQIDLNGAPTGDGTMEDPDLYGIYDGAGWLARGTWRTDDDGVGLNSRLIVTPTHTRTHYVVVGGASSGETALEGTYEMSVTVHLDDYVGDTDTPGEAEVGGGMVMGNIETIGDEDWFEVTLRADRKYAFALKGSWDAHGTLDDPYLTGIYDSDGTLIEGTSNDDTEYGPDSWVEFTVIQGGSYYVAVGADGAGTGTYKLWVEDHTGW